MRHIQKQNKIKKNVENDNRCRKTTIHLTQTHTLTFTYTHTKKKTINMKNKIRILYTKCAFIFLYTDLRVKLGYNCNSKNCVPRRNYKIAVNANIMSEASLKPEADHSGKIYDVIMWRDGGNGDGCVTIVAITARWYLLNTTLLNKKKRRICVLAKIK